MPILCHRIIRNVLGGNWYVDEDPVRMPRSKLVDVQSQPSIGVEKALRLALTREPDAVLVICDQDDDCPATWGPAMARPLGLMQGTPHAGVMACREFESWLLHARSDAELRQLKLLDPERGPRDAKKQLARLVSGYAPTTHQKNEVRAIDLERVWARSASFDKLIRTLATLTGRRVPRRPASV